MPNLLLILTHGTEEAPRVLSALTIAVTAALRGHSVVLFAMLDGISALKKTNSELELPSFPKLGKLVSDALKISNIRILACGATCDMVNVRDADLYEGIKKSDVLDFVNIIMDSEKVLTF